MRMILRAIPLLAAALLSTATIHAQMLITEPDQGFAPVYAFMQTAARTLDMTMYELVDTTAQQYLAALAKKGVKVRVILDQNSEKSYNLPAYTYLNANGCHAVWANPTYAVTHQKTITVDDATSMILTANLTSRYYTTSRDFAITDADPRDVAEIKTVFNADFASAAVTPTPADSLIWSPNEASAALTALIGSAKKTLLVESEEMGDTTIVSALTARAKAGVAVTVIITNNNNTYATEFATLTKAKVKVYTYAATAPLYIHAKVMVIDAGTAQQNAFIGSENFSVPSLTLNRELGQTTKAAAVITALNTTLTSDAKGGILWTSTKASKARTSATTPRP